MAQYIVEDFPPELALRRVRMFTKYYAANFAFGHRFQVTVSNAPSLEEAIRRGEEFFAGNPAVLANPVVAGL
jgi:tRNA-dihydrouridine synthase B